MFQLSKSQTTNTVAFYPNEVLPSGSKIQMVFTQSYSNTVTGSFIADVISNPANTPWVIAQFSGSFLPSASGQYTFDIYEVLIGGPLIWNLATSSWSSEITTWNSSGGSQTIGDQISTERAIISGSDVESLTEYVSPDENAAYITYIG